MNATHQQILKLLNPLLEQKKQLVMIDYGCGEAPLLDLIPSKKIRHYYGWDVNQHCFNVANKKFSRRKNISFKLIDKKNLPALGKKNSVDAIILVGVLQYMSPDEITHLLKQTKKILTKNGALIISCTVDHQIYKIFNIYRLFLSHRYFQRQKLINEMKEHDLKITYQREKGLLITPLFSNIFSFFFDALDKVIFKTQGKLGPIGRGVRKLVAPLIKLEYQLPIDFGYTLFIRAAKK